MRLREPALVVLALLERFDRVALVSARPERCFELFAAGFRPVEAAGGIVVDASGRRLMIHRNGRWDLPKGHREPGEAIEACARREVAEETGVEAEIRRPLCDTLHCYRLHDAWEMKRTHWFEMTAAGGGPLRPQTEEGIAVVRWCTADEAEYNLRRTFPTIRKVFSCL